MAPWPRPIGGTDNQRHTNTQNQQGHMAYVVMGTSVHQCVSDVGKENQTATGPFQW